MNIIQSLDKVFNWIENNLENFVLPEKGDFEKTLGGLKPLGELVLTMEILHHNNYKKNRCVDIMAFAWNQVEEGKLLQDALAVRPDLIVLASLYSNFKNFGFINTKLESLINYLMQTNACKNLEFPRWRKLDLIHASDSLGIHEFPSDPDRECWFYNDPEAWIMSDDIAYAITHDVFYITDFSRIPKRLPTQSRKYLTLWTPSWLEIFRQQNNWDITAELLMVSCCIKSVGEINEYTTELINAQEKDGLFPSPEGAGKQLLDYENNPDESRKRFLSNYHTCLVATMALAMLKNA